MVKKGKLPKGFEQLTKADLAQFQKEMKKASGDCPNCGYCQHCGRSGSYWPQPYYPPMIPYYPMPTFPSPYRWTYTNQPNHLVEYGSSVANTDERNPITITRVAYPEANFHL